MMTLQPPGQGSAQRRYSIDTDELVKRIHASKPKSVFLDAKPKMTNQRATFGKKSKIDVTEQGLQSIKRAAYATETNKEVNHFSIRYIFKFWQEKKANFCDHKSSIVCD